MTFKDQIKALLNSKSENNAMSQAFAFLLGLKIQKINFRVAKINSTRLEI